LIELWETYLLQLDADEDGVPFGAPVLPAGVVATPPPASSSAPDRPQTAESGEATGEEDD